jgi:hypothetical protein
MRANTRTVEIKSALAVTRPTPFMNSAQSFARSSLMPGSMRQAGLFDLIMDIYSDTVGM